MQITKPSVRNLEGNNGSSPDKVERSERAIKKARSEVADVPLKPNPSQRAIAKQSSNEAEEVANLPDFVQMQKNKP